MAKKSAGSAQDARLEALTTALSTIERKYGQGSVMRLDDRNTISLIAIDVIGMQKNRIKWCCM